MCRVVHSAAGTHHVEVHIMPLPFEHTINVLGLNQPFDLILVFLLLDVEAHVQWLAAVTLRLESCACIIAIVVDRVQSEETICSWILCTSGDSQLSVSLSVRAPSKPGVHMFQACFIACMTSCTKDLTT